MQFDTHLMHLLQQIGEATIAGDLKERARLRAHAIDHLAKIGKTDEADAIWMLEALMALFLRGSDDQYRINKSALEDSLKPLLVSQ